VNRAAARLVAVIQDADRVRAHATVRPPRDRLALVVRAQILPLEVAQFIQAREVRGVVTRTAFEGDDLHARLGELRRDDSTGGARADDDDIRFLGGHDSGRWRFAGL
jgi:hypothetical protein